MRKRPEDSILDKSRRDFIEKLVFIAASGFIHLKPDQVHARPTYNFTFFRNADNSQLRVTQVFAIAMTQIDPNACELRTTQVFSQAAIKFDTTNCELRTTQVFSQAAVKLDATNCELRTTQVFSQVMVKI